MNRKPRTLRTVINSSLFEAVENAGGHDQTAVALADIFGWDIDFVLDIQPGDSFAVSYQELYQDGVYVKDGPILAASFTNQGRTYRAVRYVDPDGNAHYYTPRRPQHAQGVLAGAAGIHPRQLGFQLSAQAPYSKPDPRP